VARFFQLNCAWRKSSQSVGDGACIEVATADFGALVRDSKNQKGVTLTVSGESWKSFVESVQAGEFNLIRSLD